MDRTDYLKSTNSKTTVFVAVMAFCFLQVFDAETYAQANRKKQLNNFSSIGKREARIRHGIAFNLGMSLSADLDQPLSMVPTAGVGYCASQYYGIGNRFMQQSVTYQLGYGLAHGGYLVHNLTGTFHCSYIGALDLNPFIYGMAMQFAYYGGDNYFRNSFANFYLRPEIGIAFPIRYHVRTAEVLRITGSFTYGFNIKTVYNFEKNDPAVVRPNPETIYLPWTAMFHHVLTLRLNINLKNQREMRR